MKAYRTVLSIQRSLRFDVYMSESKGVEQMDEELNVGQLTGDLRIDETINKAIKYHNT